MRTHDPYCTPAQLKSRFPQLTDAQWAADTMPDDLQLRDIILRGDQLIDDYCRNIYVVPFLDQDGYVSPPDTIVQLSLALAEASLREGMFAFSPVPDEQAKSKRAEVIRRLERIGAGEPPVLDWPLNDASSAPAGAPIASEAPDDRHFTIDQVF